MRSWTKNVEQQDKTAFWYTKCFILWNHFCNTNELQVFFYQQGFGNLFEI
jgi:hypothetical protein